MTNEQTPRRAFLSAVLPQTVPGLVAGARTRSPRKEARVNATEAHLPPAARRTRASGCDSVGDYVPYILGERAGGHGRGGIAPVTPGCLLELDAEFVQKRARVCKFAGKASVDGKVTCEVSFTAMIADVPN